MPTEAEDQKDPGSSRPVPTLERREIHVVRENHYA